MGAGGIGLALIVSAAAMLIQASGLPATSQAAPVAKGSRRPWRAWLGPVGPARCPSAEGTANWMSALRRSQRAVCRDPRVTEYRGVWRSMPCAVRVSTDVGVPDLLAAAMSDECATTTTSAVARNDSRRENAPLDAFVLRYRRPFPGTVVSALDAAFAYFVALDVLQQPHVPSALRVVWLDGAPAHRVDGGVLRALVHDWPAGLIARDDAAPTQQHGAMRVRTLVDVSFEPLSARGGGVSKDAADDCPCPLLRAFVRWYADALQFTPRDPRARPTAQLRVLWVSRGPYRAAGDRLVVPALRVHDEMQFLVLLASALGPNARLRSVDFADLLPQQSLSEVTECDVLVGIHGGGLAWSVFLAPDRSALVEVFPRAKLQHANNERAPSSYKSMALRAGHHYRAAVMEAAELVEPAFLLPFGGPDPQRELRWTALDVQSVASAILDLPFLDRERLSLPGYFDDRC